MLKIIKVERERQSRLRVEGKLSEPCVSELQSAWNQIRQQGSKRQIVINLSDMTYVDPKGKKMLMAMVAEGARLTAKGIYCEYVVDQLVKETQKAQARRHRGNRAGASQSRAISRSRQEMQSSPIKETQ